jgi:hypothetical protein
MSRLGDWHGRNATPVQAGEAMRTSAGGPAQWVSAGAPPDTCKVIYGGSVKPDNIRDLILLPDVDGALSAGPASTSGRFLISWRAASRLRYNRPLCSTTCSRSCSRQLPAAAPRGAAAAGKGGGHGEAFGGGWESDCVRLRARGRRCSRKATSVLGALFMIGRDRARDHRQARRSSLMGGLAGPRPRMRSAPAHTPAQARPGSAGPTPRAVHEPEKAPEKN